jgi:hypothetical protein
LAAQPVGFLQPLFAGEHGDNKTYVQRLAGNMRVAGFDPVAWPEQGTVRFEEPLAAAIGGEALWAFLFPAEAPLVLPWSDFRAALNDRFDDPSLFQRPLLRFDLVQTLGLDDRKVSVFSKAFETYAVLSKLAAERWRNRSILEPALAEAAARLHIDAGRAGMLRVRQADDIFVVELDSSVDPSVQEGMTEAFQQTITRFPSIFPRNARAEIIPAPRRQGPSLLKGATVTIILVGKLNDGQLQLPYDHDQLVDVVDADHLAMHYRRTVPSPVTLVVGIQSDWRKLVRVVEDMPPVNPLLVTLATSIAPLVRDAEFQMAAPFPSVSIFAPASLGPKGDPLKAIDPLIDILTVEGELRPLPFDFSKLPGKHNLLLREPVKKRPDEAEVACKLGARAIRAGIPPGARADLFVDADVSWPTEEAWSNVFEPLLAATVHDSSDISQKVGPRHATLLVERPRMELPYSDASLRDGVERLLAMRGWRVDRKDTYLEMNEENRRFSAIVVLDREEIPAEQGHLSRPAFGRAPLLVIHAHARRDALLVGNRGQYCHVSLDDIATMRPGSTWIWPILRRQLFVRSRNPTLAALRLAAAIAGEAIRLGRVEVVSPLGSLDALLRTLEADDCERFVDFLSDGITRREAFLRVRGNVDDDAADTIPDAVLRVGIEDDGPTLVVD